MYSSRWCCLQNVSTSLSNCPLGILASGFSKVALSFSMLKSVGLRRVPSNFSTLPPSFWESGTPLSLRVCSLSKLILLFYTELFLIDKENFAKPQCNDDDIREE